ncbi:MAG: GGDEF domain-containing protein, partial [Desulfobacterales bacterium]|nr:GGDEF domain-containing protein [Desulfobacterales bacterium]
LSLLLLDLDLFKQYNDKYGHVEGDRVLVMLSRVIASCLRANDSAYRYGGEEFTVILPETGSEEAKIVAERIRTSVEAEVLRPSSGGGVVTTSISIGVTQYIPGERISAFVERADMAMYTSKENGRNRVTAVLGRGEENVNG